MRISWNQILPAARLPTRERGVGHLPTAIRPAVAGRCFSAVAVRHNPDICLDQAIS